MTRMFSIIYHKLKSVRWAFIYYLNQWKYRNELPIVLNTLDTLRLIKECNLSISRYGDGEVYQIGGRNLGFSNYSKSIGEPDKRSFERPSIESWLKSIDECDYIITDSFHGTVFAIIFQKSFITIANYDRGVDRFNSLLGSLNLTDRIIPEVNWREYNTVLNKPIDWEAINSLQKVAIKESLDFLTHSLSL